MSNGTSAPNMLPPDFVAAIPKKAVPVLFVTAGFEFSAFKPISIDPVVVTALMAVEPVMLPATVLGAVGPLVSKITVAPAPEFGLIPWPPAEIFPAMETPISAPDVWRLIPAPVVEIDEPWLTMTLRNSLGVVPVETTLKPVPVPEIAAPDRI